MGKWAVLSDVHGNARALDAVLEGLDAEDVSDVACLGDLVGFCAEPNACVQTAVLRRFIAIAGNHELVALGTMGFERCGLAPAHALARTRRMLDRASREYLATLPEIARRGEAVLVHGSVDDPCEYMTTPEAILRSARALAERHPGARVCFFGHTHVPSAYEVRAGRADAVDAEGELLLAGSSTWFVNPGAVDGSRAPRDDGDAVARYVVVDDDGPRVSFKVARYDHDTAERQAREHGYRLPRATLAWHAVYERLANLANLVPGTGRWI
jgi:predicted phosphodiesterase